MSFSEKEIMKPTMERTSPHYNTKRCCVSLFILITQDGCGVFGGDAYGSTFWRGKWTEHNMLLPHGGDTQ